MPALDLPAGPVTYEIRRRRRKTIGLSVRRDGSVEVSAPRRTTRREVEQTLRRHERWIARQREAALERLARRPPLRFEDGEQVPFLGGSLDLRVSELLGGARDARRVGDDLIVCVPFGLAPAARRARVRSAVVRWLLAQAQQEFHASHARAAQSVGLSAVRVVIKDMRTRWGSCGPNRRMSLNWRLILAPREVLDYVLVHELCHIEIPNHSRAFWRRVEGACPHWRTSREWLRVHADELEL